MKGRRLLALSVLAIALACQDRNSPTEPRGLSAPTGPAGAISDGAHGGNPDFFFLPPMVSNPVTNSNYEAARFNATLGPLLTIEICRLQSAPVDANGNPLTTYCATGVPLVKKFATGTVQLQGTATDGHYQAQWNTRESNLDVTQYYRIKILIEGSTTPLGFADIDPLENKSQLKNARTGEVISLIDDSTLPIKFRVEKSALCNPGESLCTSTIVTNHTPNGEPQIVRIFGDDGSAIAGVLIPDGFLPETGPQSVVLTIDRVNTGVNNVAAGTQSIPCHANLPLQQFNSCFHFSTIPELATLNEEGHQFLKQLTVAVCFVLHDLEDPREPWVQLWSSEEGGEDAKPLPSASATQILAGPGGEACGENLTVASTPSNGFARFASAGWKKVKGGLGLVFGVKTAYAVDVGLGGLTWDLSNIGPALTAQIQRYTDTDLTLGPGATTTSTARIVGTRVHNGGPLTTGIGGLPVTFTVAANNGSLKLIGSELPGASVLTSITNTNPINPESPTSGGGFAPVNWTLPTVPGTYTLTATGPATGGPVTFTATVVAPPSNTILLWPAERRMLSMQTGATIQLADTGESPIVAWFSDAESNVQVSESGLVTAIVGGESIEGGGDATLASLRADDSGGPNLLVNSFSFDIFPRTTTLAWNSVAGAVSYQVVTEFGNASPTNPFCTVPAECGVWTQQLTGSTTTAGLMHTFDFVGSQPGRWRVFALNAAGAIINTSPYVYFDYDI